MSGSGLQPDHTSKRRQYNDPDFGNDDGNEHSHIGHRRSDNSRSHFNTRPERSDIDRDRDQHRDRRSTNPRDRSPLGREGRSEASTSYTDRQRSSYNRERELYARRRQVTQADSRGSRYSEFEVDRRPGQTTQPRGNKEQKTQTSDCTCCLYCGGDLEVQNECSNNKGYHRKCIEVHTPRCKEAVEAFRETISLNEHVLSMAIGVTFLYGSGELNQDKKKKGEPNQDKKKKKKEQRDTKISELVKNASALLNSNSGYLLIHLVGLDPKDTFTGALDEFVDTKLQDLITDGRLFTDVYEKKLLSTYPSEKFKKYTDILVLYVDGADSPLTSDYKTKVALDDSIIDIPDVTLVKFMKKRKTFNQEHHDIRVTQAEKLCCLQESRHIQVKAYVQPKSSDDVLVSNIFDNLRVTEYISAFSKVKDGGSYLLGLKEDKRPFEQYLSKKFQLTPILLDNCEVVKKLIIDRVSDTCLVCDYDGNKLADGQLVKVFCIPCDKCGYVVRVSVRSVNGIVFYDKNGPEAYRINTLSHLSESSSVVRLTVSEWFQAFLQRLQEKGDNSQ